MTIGALTVSLGTVGLQTGWYMDPATGEHYYYNAEENKWYVYAAGYIYPLEIQRESGPKTIPVAIGDKVQIDISYKYMGPATTGVEEYISIGYERLAIWPYDYVPKLEAKRSRNLDKSAEPKLYTWSATLTIPSDVGSNWTCIECKVWKGSPAVPEQGRRYTRALEIVALKPVVAEFTIVDYKVAA